MPFFRESRDARRLAAMAAALVSGACCAFAVPQCAELWPVFAYVAVAVFLAAWGWGVRGLRIPAVFVFGALTAFHADDTRARVMAENANLRSARDPLVLEVEGGVAEWTRKRDGASFVSFMSHAGPLPIKVVMPKIADAPLPQIGEKWKCLGWISRRDAHGNRFSAHPLWVVSGGTYAERIAPASPWSPRVIYAAFSEELSRRAGAGLDWCGEIAGLNRAILLGRRSGLTQERREMFAAAGTIHVFAISGLHVMVVAWLISKLLVRLDVPFRVQGLVAVPLVVAYTMLTGARPSAVRAAFMASLYLLAPAVGRRPDPLAAWSATALVVYGLWPERIFDVACTLSFVVMFGIVLWGDGVRYLVSPLRMGESPGWHQADWRRRLRYKVESFLGGVCVSVAAWIASVPVTACVFSRFTVGGLVANIVLILCARKMVLVGAVGVALSFLCLPLGALFNNVAALFTGAMVYASERVAELPWASMSVKPWGAWTCLAWYAFWLALFAVLCWLWPRRVPRPKSWW